MKNQRLTDKMPFSSGVNITHHIIYHVLASTHDRREIARGLKRRSPGVTASAIPHLLTQTASLPRPLQDISPAWLGMGTLLTRLKQLTHSRAVRLLREIAATYS